MYSTSGSGLCRTSPFYIVSTSSEEIDFTQEQFIYGPKILKIQDDEGHLAGSMYIDTRNNIIKFTDVLNNDFIINTDFGDCYDNVSRL